MAQTLQPNIICRWQKITSVTSCITSLFLSQAASCKVTKRWNPSAFRIPHLFFSFTTQSKYHLPAHQRIFRNEGLFSEDFLRHKQLHWSIHFESQQSSTSAAGHRDFIYNFIKPPTISATLRNTTTKQQYQS